MIKMHRSRAGAELSLNTIIMLIIAVMILVLVVVILAKYGGPLLGTLRERLNTSIGISQSVDLKP